MAQFSDKNFCRKVPEGIADGDEFLRCNLVQLQPHTPVCVGKIGLVFRRCNLVNCDLPPDAIAEDCAQGHVSRCAWLHPEWPLPAEPTDCPHVTTRHTVTVDGATVATEYERADRMVT
jgi:hypothetical protein